MPGVKNLAIIAISLLAIYNTARTVIDINTRTKKLGSIQNEVQRLENEQKELKAELKYRKTNEFVEKEARDKLMMAFPGEVMLVIPKTETAKDILGSSTINTTNQNQTPLWKQWIDLFF